MQLAVDFIEFDMIANMLRDSARGICFKKDFIASAEKDIKIIDKANGLKRLMSLIFFLDKLARAEYDFLNRNRYLPKSSINLKRIRKVYEIVDSEYQQNLSTREVASRLGMEESSFCRFFSKSTGSTFKKTLTDKRIRTAIYMLSEGNEPIRSIAFDCGFNSISLFNRLFKKKMNMSPRKYRDKFSSIQSLP